MSTQITTTTAPQRQSALAVMGQRLQVDPGKLLDTLKATVFRGASDHEVAALVVVSNQYNLNPFTREIYAFQAKGGGIQPIISIDGWLRIINDRPELDGLETSETIDAKGNLVSTTCTVWRKDRTRPTTVTEYLVENQRNTEPWQTRPRRMLRHKAIIQCARVAFGLGGLPDDDEAAPVVNVTATATMTDSPQPARPVFLPRRMEPVKVDEPSAAPPVEEDNVPMGDQPEPAGEPEQQQEEQPRAATDPRQFLADLCASSGVSEEDFLDWLHTYDARASRFESIGAISDRMAAKVAGDQTALAVMVRKFGRK